MYKLLCIFDVLLSTLILEVMLCLCWFECLLDHEGMVIPTAFHFPFLRCILYLAVLH